MAVRTIPTVSTAPTDERSRPRVEGAREEEILAAALGLLAEVGYDRLTMDAVATAAKAGKATLYRRWTSKADLVVDAVSRAKACPAPRAVDTGSLRGDLLAMSCGSGGLTDQVPMSVLASLVTALPREPELADAFQRLFLGPRIAVAMEIFERARSRGEISSDVDPRLIATVLPSVVIHRQFLQQQNADEDFIERVVDEVVLPACRR
jgi:AcrR family transcriptional regulator